MDGHECELQSCAQMDEETVRRLLKISAALYRDRADEFDRTRSAPWRGWRRVLERTRARMGSGRGLRVLDAGCGNARFASFASSWGPLDYSGVDSSAPLLARARERLEGLASRGALVRYRLFERELTSPAALEDLEEAELVAAMGVLHHIPGARTRERLLAALAGRLAPGGVLAVTLWRFDPGKAFDWIDVNRILEEPIDPSQLEPGDFVLRFGESGLRYCHLAGEEELAELVRATGLQLAESFDADFANRYLIFVR